MCLFNLTAQVYFICNCINLISTSELTERKIRVSLVRIFSIVLQYLVVLYSQLLLFVIRHSLLEEVIR